jgi:hypothetical protein
MELIGKQMTSDDKLRAVAIVAFFTMLTVMFIWGAYTDKEAQKECLKHHKPADCLVLKDK